MSHLNEAVRPMSLAARPHLTWPERIENYRRSRLGLAYPDSVPAMSPTGRWVTATWILGQDYRSRTDLYGAYPPGYLPRIAALTTDIPTTAVLHVFAGKVDPAHGRTIDRVVRRPDLTVQGDATAMPFVDGAFSLALADPPYSGNDATRYGVPMVNRTKALYEVARVLRPGGLLFWMDTQVPMFRKLDWRWVGLITIVRSVNHRYRGVAIFERSSSGAAAGLPVAARLGAASLLDDPGYGGVAGEGAARPSTADGGVRWINGQWAKIDDVDVIMRKKLETLMHPLETTARLAS